MKKSLENRCLCCDSRIFDGDHKKYCDDDCNNKYKVELKEETEKFRKRKSEGEATQTATLEESPTPNTRATSNTRKALLIGNTYPNEDSPLSSCVNDANAMNNVLSSHCSFICEPTQSNLDRTAIKLVLLEFGNKLNDGDTALFYFSGHGVSYDGVDYLVPCGVENEIAQDPKLIPTFAISLHSVQEMLGEAGKGTKEDGRFSFAFQSFYT
mgnify:CR=1 FL=1